MTPAVCSLVITSRASSCAVVRSSVYGTVTAGFTWYVPQQVLEVRDALAERARIVVVVDDTEHTLLRRELLRARVDGLALCQLRSDERGPVLTRLLG